MSRAEVVTLLSRLSLLVPALVLLSSALGWKLAIGSWLMLAWFGARNREGARHV